MTLTTLVILPRPEPKWVMDASGNWVLKQFIRFKDAAGRLAEMEVTQTQIGGQF